MKPLTADQIRDSMVNTTDADLARLPIPGLYETMWDEREYLGWRDPDGSPRGYIVHWVEDRPVGFMVRAASATLRPGIGAMCSFCHTPQPSTQVLMFSAPKGGEAGRDGNSIGTYLCADLACSMMIRMLPATSELNLSRTELVARRGAGLTERLQRFTANLLKTA